MLVSIYATSLWRRFVASEPVANTLAPPSDRELTFVPKKGRPVTQCPHCRSERKKRSAHVKCECGEKPHPKEKCIHLREAEAKAAAAAGTTCTSTSNTTPESDEHHHPSPHELCAVPEETSADEHHCCCPHGGKCTCATLGKESPDSRGETPPTISHPRPKHHLKSHQSEGHLTVFANGHHKPVHRNNNAAHESGAPYKLPRSHTTHGHSNIARRSVDSLASVQSVSPVSWQKPPSIGALAIPKDLVKAQSERGSPQSENSTSHHSPFDMSLALEATSFPAAPESSTSVASNSTLYQDFGMPSTQSALSIATSATEPSMSAFSLPTSGLDFSSDSANDYWSKVNWDQLDTNLEPQPALTNASSGTISEIDDLPRIDDLTGFDATYSMDSAAQMSGFDFSNDFSTNSNFGTTNNVNANSNRWSLPSFSNQDNANTFVAGFSANSSTKDLPMQSFGISQQDVQSQSMMNSVAPPAHSQSPGGQGSEDVFQTKGADFDNFGWENLMPEYNAGASSNSNVNNGIQNVDDSLNFPVSGAPSVSASQDPNVQGSSGLEGFNNSYRTMQWDDGMSMPVDPDFANSYTFDASWVNGDFSTPWS